MFGFRGDNFIAVITCDRRGVVVRFRYQTVAKVMNYYRNSLFFVVK